MAVNAGNFLVDIHDTWGNRDAFYRNIQRIQWTKHRSNEEVLKKMGKTFTLNEKKTVEITRAHNKEGKLEDFDMQNEKKQTVSRWRAKEGLGRRDG